MAWSGWAKASEGNVPGHLPRSPAGRQHQQQQLAFRWMAGRCGLAGHAVNPPPGSGPAAGGCAFGRLRSSASQTKRPHPWGLDGAIHGANGPASPHRPTSDRFRALSVGADRWSVHLSDIEINCGSEPVPTNGRHPPVPDAVPVDPRHAWMTLPASPGVSSATLRGSIGSSLMTLIACNWVLADGRHPGLTRHWLSALPPDVSGLAR